MKHYVEPVWVRNIKLTLHEWKEKISNKLDKRTTNLKRNLYLKVEAVDAKIDRREKPKLTDNQLIVKELKWIKRISLLCLIALVVLCWVYIKMSV